MNPLAADLDNVLSRTVGLWEELRGGRLFLTGGTGFFGCWLLESFLWASEKLCLNAETVVLTRNPEAFACKAPHLAFHKAVKLHTGNLDDFTLPEGSFTHVIHAAGDLSKGNSDDAAGLLTRSFCGLQRVLELARQSGAAKVLCTSSGAVYGPAVPGRWKLREDDPPSGIPLETRGAYAEAKRMAELLGTLSAQQHGFEFKIARGFAFLGPYLPLDAHLAAGNFIRDALAGSPIMVRGSGTAVRSYMYPADLAVGLWKVLFRGAHGRPYNLGSDQPVTIAELAHAVARECDPPPPVSVLEQARPEEVVDYYVPDITRARTELGLDLSLGLAEAIRCTLAWHQRITKAT